MTNRQQIIDTYVRILDSNPTPGAVQIALETARKGLWTDDRVRHDVFIEQQSQG